MGSIFVGLVQIMSYIPKYIIKRLVPPDALKKVEGGVEIHIINVISPLSVDEIPQDIDPLEYLEVKLDGKELPREKLEQLVLTWGDQKFTFSTLNEMVGQTIAVGQKLSLFFPSDDIKKGEEHEIEVTVKLDNPINVKVTRTVQ